MWQGTMQEHECKEPTDSLAPWFDVIRAFVAKGILSELKDFLKIMCHTRQSTRSSRNWPKPMRPLEQTRRSVELQAIQAAEVMLFMVKLWSGLNGLILTPKRRIHRIQNRCFIFLCFFLEWCNLTTPKDHKRSNFKNKYTDIQAVFVRPGFPKLMKLFWECVRGQMSQDKKC